jgi:hypothetical protein
MNKCVYIPINENVFLILQPLYSLNYHTEFPSQIIYERAHVTQKHMFNDAHEFLKKLK